MPEAPPPDDPASGPNRVLPTTRVPDSRGRRLWHLGRTVGGIAAGAAAEGLSRMVRGERADLASLVLTPANAERLAESLATMRGAVMKVGQLMSMDGHGVLPPAFAELLGRLRDGAHAMPATQLVETLAAAYGADWHRRFRRFSFAPVASASIGQVHRAETHDGRVLALKIQHPGVRRSIDADIANLALLARTPGLLPPTLDPAPLLERVRQQLHRETDYVAEARALQAYRQQLGDDPLLVVPEVDAEFSTPQILATRFVPGEPVDRLAARSDLAPARRDAVATALCRLALRELFEMRLVQTDPNFANYLVDAATGHVALIDFGATEEVAEARVVQMREFGRALRDGDSRQIEAAARVIGFIDAADPPAQTAGVMRLLEAGAEPLRHRGPYDFARTDLVARVFSQGRSQFFGEGFARTPPPDLVFLYRKFVGTFLLCVRLGARVDLGALFDTALGAPPGVPPPPSSPSSP
jgi:predicted unusual protein kinase regulating ubiquinone biosynthesis (AarF/ABC1/UbiB family)